MRLRRAYEAFNRGDFDGALTFAHPDVEVPRGRSDPYRGIEKFRAWMEPDAFEEQLLEPLEFIVSGNEISVRQRMSPRGIEWNRVGRSSPGPCGPSTKTAWPRGWSRTDQEEAEAREAAGLLE